MKIKRRSKITPSSLILYVTKRCNSRCPYCIWILKDEKFFHTSTESDMPLETAKEIVNFYYKTGVRIVRLQAEGEVFMYKHLEELLFYCKKIGYKDFVFPTNGLLLDNYIDFVLDNLCTISISIDGHDAESYIKHRGGTESTFDKLIKNVEMLTTQKKQKKADTVIWINCIITQTDYKKAIPMVELARKLGVDKIRFGNYHPVQGGKGLKPVSEKEIKYLSKKLKKYKKYVGIKLPRISKPQFPFHCNMLFKTALIGSECSFAPCCRIDSDAKWGSFYQDTKHNSIELQKLRQRFITAKKIEDLPKDCRQCGRLKKCKRA